MVSVNGQPYRAMLPRRCCFDLAGCCFCWAFRLLFGNWLGVYCSGNLHFHIDKHIHTYSNEMCTKKHAPMTWEAKKTERKRGRESDEIERKAKSQESPQSKACRTGWERDQVIYNANIYDSCQRTWKATENSFVFVWLNVCVCMLQPNANAHILTHTIHDMETRKSDRCRRQKIQIPTILIKYTQYTYTFRTQKKHQKSTHANGTQWFATYKNGLFSKIILISSHNIAL